VVEAALGLARVDDLASSAMRAYDDISERGNHSRDFIVR
jgi:hypothetical protein